MSGLWDYDDDDADVQELDTFQPPPPTVVVDEDDAEVARPSHKRKAGRKAANAGAGRSKRRVASPLSPGLSLKPMQQPVAILISSDDEDDDVLFPVADKSRNGAAGMSTNSTPAGPSMAAGASRKPAAPSLDPATREALAREQAMLSALRQVTALQQDDDGEEDFEMEPLPSASRLQPVGFPRLSSRLPSEALDGGKAGFSAGSGAGDGAAWVSAAGGAGPGITHAGSHQPPSAEDEGGLGGDGAVGGTVLPEPAAEDRVRLKLAWNSGKDGHVMMRVVKTDPLAKMMQKFREIAQQRKLCKDPTKIKFLFDGDNLSKTPDSTPEDLDLEDDMMIDIKL